MFRSIYDFGFQLLSETSIELSEENKKSDPISYRKQVRIIFVWSEYRNSNFRMAKQLSENYGEHLHTKDLTQEPERIDALEVNGKTYTASYFGEQDISMVKGYKIRKFWRLEDAYEDFKELPTPREILPADNYPVKIQAGQVFAVEYLMSDGSTEWKYYISDGTVQNGQLITKRMKME